MAQHLRVDLARIPQFRQDYYMAHGPKDLNAFYKRMREVRASLAEDAAARAPRPVNGQKIDRA